LNFIKLENYKFKIIVESFMDGDEIIEFFKICNKNINKKNIKMIIMDHNMQRINGITATNIVTI
jgi:hypothetical protein